MELVVIKDSCFSVQFINDTFYICTVSAFIFLFFIVMTEVMSPRIVKAF